MKTTVLLEQEPVADGGWVVRALLRIEGEAPAETERAPLNLSLVLDRSGSMEGEKLDAAREAVLHLLRRLSPPDVVSVVTYDDQIETLAPARALRDAPELFTKVRDIDCGGSTNLSGGWLRGRELVSGARNGQRIHRVILLTDGLANVGIQDPGMLADLTARAREDGITTTTIGFGVGYDEGLLRSMADRGGGQTYYIESPDQAPSVFAHEIDGLLGVAAQNLAVKVTAGAAQLIAIHHAYPRTMAGDSIRLDLGDLYATEPKSVLVELLIDAPETDAPIVVAELEVTGVVFNADGSVEQRTIALPVSVSLAEGAKVDAQVRREALLLEAARAREIALEEQRRGDVAGAQATLRAASMRLRQAPGADADMLSDADDLEQVACAYDLSAPSIADEKYLQQRAYDAMRSKREKGKLIQRRRPPA